LTPHLFPLILLESIRMSNTLLADLQRERADLVKCTQDAQTEAEQLRQSLQSKQETLNALETQVTSLQTDLKELQTIKEEIFQRESSLSKELAQQETELSNAHRESAQIAQQLGPTFQKQKRFEDALKSIELKLDQMSSSPQGAHSSLKNIGIPRPALASAPALPKPPSHDAPTEVLGAPAVHDAPASSKDDDANRQPRIPLKIDLQFELKVSGDSSHNFYTGLTDNISEGGLFIATEQLIDIGTVISFQFMLPGMTEPVPLDGVVRWVRASDGFNDDLESGMGVQFTNLTPHLKERIHNFIEQRDSIFYDD
jgi:type IV pilus assembly protein PilZ